MRWYITVILRFDSWYITLKRRSVFDPDYFELSGSPLKVCVKIASSSEKHGTILISPLCYPHESILEYIERKKMVSQFLFWMLQPVNIVILMCLLQMKHIQYGNTPQMTPPIYRFDCSLKKISSVFTDATSRCLLTHAMY